MSYESLNHSVYLVLLSRYFRKGPFHAKESSLSCPDSKLFRFQHRGYAEVIVDLERTLCYGTLWVAFYFPGLPWQPSIDARDYGLCKKCAKNILDYVKGELAVPTTRQRALISSNGDLIREALTTWPN